MGATCGCGRSITETMMDEFWKNLNFRKLTPEDYEKLYTESKNPEKEKIKDQFKFATENENVNKAFETLYNNLHKDKNFFISLLLLLNNHDNLKTVFIFIFSF